MILVLALLLAPPATAAGMCRDSQPCGISCIPWDQPCVVAQRHVDGDDDDWSIPWELLNLKLVRTIAFVAVYAALLPIARRKSVGPREV